MRACTRASCRQYGEPLPNDDVEVGVFAHVCDEHVVLQLFAEDGQVYLAMADCEARNLAAQLQLAASHAEVAGLGNWEDHGDEIVA